MVELYTLATVYGYGCQFFRDDGISASNTREASSL